MRNARHMRTVSIGLLLISWTVTTQSSIAANTPAYGNCPAPPSASVRICQPFIISESTTIASPFQLIASGTGSNGPVERMEIWVDFVKIKQFRGSLIDAPLTLSPGNHRLVVVEVDTTGAFMKSVPIAVSVQSNTIGETCPATSNPGVNVCQPTLGSCHTTAWTTILAAGTGTSRSVRRMELWSNGVKLANFFGDTINTNLYLPDFSTVTIVEVDSAGAFIKSPRITIQSC